ncbi:MAG: hypothetical protein ABI855_13050 [Bacteroidota bacterium]
MRKNYSKFILIAGFIAVLSSCSKDETTVTSTDKYTGTWSCKEVQGTASTTFTITIQKYGNEDSLSVFNFDNLGSNEKALFIVNDNSVVIPSQNVGVNPSYSVAGSGTYSGGKINLSYTVDGDSYTAVCTK